MGRAAGARGGLDEGAGGAGRGAGGQVQCAERVCDDGTPMIFLTDGLHGLQALVNFWPLLKLRCGRQSTCHNLIVLSNTGSPVSRIAAASRRLHMGTSPVAGSALPKRNTLLHPPQADIPWTYRTQVVMADAGQAGPNGIRQGRRDHLPENVADPLRLDCSVHIQRAITQVCFVKITHTTFIEAIIAIPYTG
jgi:hypothetical protein